MKKHEMKKTAEDYIIDTIVFIISALVFIATVYPFYYSLVISFNNGIDASSGGIFFWPRKFTLDNYRAVFLNEQLLNGFVITILRTVIGTFASLLVTGLFAYSLSYKDLMFKRFYMALMIIAMYFSGGIIPYFILIKKLALLDSFWVYIIPNLISIFNVIIMINFFKEIPSSLKEAAKIDGANDLKIFFKIIVPVSMPVFATIALFTGVGHWNNWFDAAYFVTDKNLKTIAYILMQLINSADLTSVQGGISTASAEKNAAAGHQTFTAETIRMATMIIVTIPIICVYPFLQKYFVKGIMVGSVKE
jgi:putative aldouronate transport system permease protein